MKKHTLRKSIGVFDQMFIMVFYAKQGLRLAEIKRKARIQGDEMINKCVQQNFLIPKRKNRATFFDVSREGVEFLNINFAMISRIGLDVAPEIKKWMEINKTSPGDLKGLV